VKPKGLVTHHEQYGKHKPAMHDCPITEQSTYNLELKFTVINGKWELQQDHSAIHSMHLTV